MSTIFIVEDDGHIRELILYALETTEFTGVAFESAEDCMQAMKEDVPDLILLDIMLPNISGIHYLKHLRNQVETKDIPVILLTARGDEYDKINGLESGADDYIVKPFSVLELFARIRAVLRRRQRFQDEMQDYLVVGGITLLPTQRKVIAGEKEIHLTYKEYELLNVLLHNKGRVFSRDDLMDRVWGVKFYGESRTVDMHIRTLRQKLGEQGNLIKTIRGVGYKIDN